MKGLDREFIAQVVVAASVAVGGWVLLVQPATTEIAELEARIDHAREVQSTLDEETVATIASRVGSLRDRVTAIESQSALSADSSKLFGRVMDLAALLDVEVQSLQPGSRLESNAGDDALGTKKTQIDLSVAGEYESVAEFIDMLESIDGFIRPASVRMQPQATAESNTRVLVQVTCDALAFPLPTELAGLAGASDVVE